MVAQKIRKAMQYLCFYLVSIYCDICDIQFSDEILVPDMPPTADAYFRANSMSITGLNWMNIVGLNWISIAELNWMNIAGLNWMNIAELNWMNIAWLNWMNIYFYFELYRCAVLNWMKFRRMNVATNGQA